MLEKFFSLKDVLKRRNKKSPELKDVKSAVLRTDGGLSGNVSGDAPRSKNMEEELRESEERYRLLAELAQEMIFVVGRDGAVRYVNTFAAKSLGKKPSDIIGKPRSMFFPPQTSHRQDEMINSVFRTGKPVYTESETEFRGRKAWLSTRLVPVRDSRGAIIEVFGISRDITEQKKLVEKLQKFKLGLERSTDAVFITDTEGKIIYVNPAFEQVYGYKKEEALGKTPRIIKSGLISDKQYGKFWGALLAKQTVTGDIINRRKDGALLNIDGSNNPIVDDSGNIIGFLAIHRDITERKKAEDDLKKANENLKEAQRIANFGNWEWDVLTNEVIWSEQVYGIYGLDPKKDKPTYKTVIDTLAPECRKRFIDAIKGSLKRAEPFEGEYCIVLPDGTKKYTHTAGSIVKGKNGKPVKMFGVVQDITERKAAEFAKEKLNAELQAKVDELERFNRLAVGRELKMVELKKKIKALEEKTQG